MCGHFWKHKAMPLISCLLECEGKAVTYRSPTSITNLNLLSSCILIKKKGGGSTTNALLRQDYLANNPIFFFC